MKPRRAASPSAVRTNSRWLTGSMLVLLVLFLIGDAMLRRETLRAVTAVQTADAPSASLPISPGARLRSEVFPIDAIDGRWWMIYAEQFLRGNDWRIRQTRLDNAPAGREVHWSSSMTWLLGAVATAVALFQQRPAADYVTQAAFWVGPIHLILCLLLLGSLAARRFGATVAAFFAAVFCLSPLVYQCFRVGMVDHHGLICTFAVASVLCLVAGGAGLVRAEGKKAAADGFRVLTLDEARRWFRWSGLLGGAALWISAATFIPILAGCGLGAVAALLLRDRDTSVPAPELWRTWAKAGALSSFAFYLLEYFPGHLGWRLEVNHPLFALAWLGAGDLLARLNAVLAGRPAFPRGPRSMGVAAAALTAIVIPPILIRFRAHDFFWVSDKFILLLWNEFVLELQSLPHFLANHATLDTLLELFLWPAFVLGGAAYLFGRGLVPPRWRSPLAMVLAPTLVLQGLGWWQIRWLVVAAAFWALGALVLFAASADRASRPSRAFRAAFAVAALLMFVLLPGMSFLALARLEAVVTKLPKAMIPPILARDVAHRLVQSSPHRLPVVLSGPTTSTELNYFAGLQTLGTLYWENLAGLKRAAHIFAAADAEQARRLIAAAGVTHLLVSTWDNFGTAYVDLLRQAEEEKVPPRGQTFIEVLLRENQPPDWLRPLYYPIPAGFEIQEELRLYAVVPEQTPAVARLHRGIYAFDARDFKSAERMFTEAQALDPQLPELPALLAEARRLQALSPLPSAPHAQPTPP